MDIVIDINTLSPVFDPNNAAHNEFRPVLEYIQNKRGKMVYGGTKYIDELGRARKFLKIIIELEKADRAVELACNIVDTEERRVRRRDPANGFNDHHIIAIVIVGRCGTVCSNDRSAHPFFRNNKLYPKHFRRPGIYTGTSSSRSLRN